MQRGKEESRFSLTERERRARRERKGVRVGTVKSTGGRDDGVEKL